MRHTCLPRLSCLFLAVVTVVVHAAVGPTGSPRRLAHQTFYASFDDGLAADHAIGLDKPLAAGYARCDTPGHAGTALTYDGRNPRHARVFYSAPGNLHPSRGTCSLWFKADSDEDGALYCRPVLLGLSTAVEGYWGCALMWGPRMMSGKTPIGKCYASLFEGSHGLHLASYGIEDRWRKGEWHHLALVWDSRMGIRMYDNGELVASVWGPEHGWAEVPDCPARHFSLGFFNHSFRGGGRPGYAIDEVRLFDGALSGESVAALCADDFDAPIRQETIPGETLRRTLERMGWTGDDRADLVPVTVIPGGGRPTRIRVNAIDEAVDAERPLSHLSDGLPTSGWRHPTYGASVSGRTVDLRLREPGRFNRIEMDVFRRFRGRFIKASVDEPMPPNTDIAVPDDRMHWRWSSKNPLTTRLLRIERDEGRIAEVRLWEVLQDQESFPLPPGPQRTWQPVFLLDPVGDLRTLAGRAARQSHAEAPIGWRLAQRPENVPVAPLSLVPLRPACFISKDIHEDIAIGAVTFHLHLREVVVGSVIHLELRDPVWPTRRLFEGDFRLEGDQAGEAEVAIDLPDLFVSGRPAAEPFPDEGHEVSAWQARQPLRLMAVAATSHAMTLVRFELVVHETDRAQAIAEHNRTQLPYIREGYADTSESRAYGWHPLAYEKLFFPLHDFLQREPDRLEIRALAGRVGLFREPLKPVMPQAESGIPQWASLQIELLKRCRALCHYWIDERELPNGEVGGGLGDDTDFKDDWVNLALISDDDGRIAASIRRLADTAWTRDGMDRGYQLWWRDALHAVEEGASLQPHLMYLYPGDPVGIERSMQMCGHLDDWMGTTPTGKLHFKSWYVGGKGRIRTDFRYGEDRPICGLFLVMPSQYVWYSGQPDVARRIVKWCDSWLSYLDDTGPNGGPLGLPTAVDWETGDVVGKRIRLHLGEGGFGRMLVPFVCAYRHTGDERYLRLHRLAARGLARAKSPSLGSWLAELVRLGNDKDRALVRETIVPLAYARGEDVPGVARDPSHVRTQLIPQYVAWQLTGDKRYLEVGLACALTFMDEQMPALTWALPSTDRIPQPRETLDRMALGGLATLRPGYGPPYPEHAVSYRGLGESVAALVTINRLDRVRITFFNTDPDPRRLTLRFWQIKRGHFMLVQSPADDDGDSIRTEKETGSRLLLQRGQPVGLDLPPRQLHVVDLRLAEALPPPAARPDLAISVSEIEADLNAGHVTVVVHNLGMAPARRVCVRLLDGKTGTSMDEKSIDELGAPLDLKPRVARLQFFNADTAVHGRLRVVVDPDAKIDETDENNNSAEFAF